MRELDTIYDAFERNGSYGYGENLSQLQHALQCAQLARDHDCSDALIVAALLHDFGHMLAPEGNAIELQGANGEHGQVGADWLSAIYPLAVTEPIRLHVAAKRYLCATDPIYEGRLSAASKLSLAVQGGPYTPEEAAAFEQNPFFADAVLIRRFDDWGKRVGSSVADLGAYAKLLKSQCVKQVFADANSFARPVVY